MLWFPEPKNINRSVGYEYLDILNIQWWFHIYLFQIGCLYIYLYAWYYNSATLLDRFASGIFKLFELFVGGSLFSKRVFLISSGPSKTHFTQLFTSFYLIINFFFSFKITGLVKLSRRTSTISFWNAKMSVKGCSHRSRFGVADALVSYKTKLGKFYEVFILSAR